MCKPPLFSSYAFQELVNANLKEQVCFFPGCGIDNVILSKKLPNIFYLVDTFSAICD